MSPTEEYLEDTAHRGRATLKAYRNFRRGIPEGPKEFLYVDAKAKIRLFPFPISTSRLNDMGAGHEFEFYLECPELEAEFAGLRPLTEGTSIGNWRLVGQHPYPTADSGVSIYWQTFTRLDAHSEEDVRLQTPSKRREEREAIRLETETEISANELIKAVGGTLQEESLLPVPPIEKLTLWMCDDSFFNEELDLAAEGFSTFVSTLTADEARRFVQFLREALRNESDARRIFSLRNNLEELRRIIRSGNLEDIPDPAPVIPPNP